MGFLADTWEKFRVGDGVNIAGIAWKDLLGQANGSATNDLAKAGSLGEYKESIIASGSAVALTTGVAANLTSLVLTPGDWDVSSTVEFTGNALTTVTYIASSHSTTSATIDAAPGQRMLNAYNNVAVLTTQPDIALGPTRYSVAANTTKTVYLVVQAGFGVNTCSAFGILRAGRRR